jgi:hypothetical protein
MTEEIPTVVVVVATETTAVEVSEAATVVPGKCIKSSVRIAGLRPKFLSSRQKDGRFTAEIACLTTGSSKLKILKVKC